MRRRTDIMKPEIPILNVHGPTVTGSEGEQARRYRKVTTAAFGHQMFTQAWNQGVAKAGILARRLVHSEGRPGEVKKELELVTFAVVSEVCFGIGVTEEGHMELKKHQPHEGSMSYWESFAVSAEFMGVTFLTPKAVLKRSPLKVHRKAYESNKEWLAYMEDMIQEKRLEREDGEIPSSPNLLG
jgi:cytochrome P450